MTAKYTGWVQAMASKMEASRHNVTWVLIDLLVGKVIVRYCQVYIVKQKLDGTVNMLKARFAMKGYTQTYGADFFEFFTPVAQLKSYSFVVFGCYTSDWPLLQLNVKNAFHHGNLYEEVYVEQSTSYVAGGLSKGLQVEECYIWS